MTLTKIARLSTLLGYFGLLILLTLWVTVFAPPSHRPIALVLPIMVGPLLFALRGVLHGRPYTHAWLSMLSLLYFTHGVVETWSNSAERRYAALEVACSVLLFLGSMFFARFRAREMKSPPDEGVGKERT